jgi:hypothetical protein
MKITTERLREIVKISAATMQHVAMQEESALMAAEILTLREDLSKAYRQIQFRVDERELARNDRAAVFAEYDKARVENTQLRALLADTASSLKELADRTTSLPKRLRALVEGKATEHDAGVRFAAQYIEEENGR